MKKKGFVILPPAMRAVSALMLCLVTLLSFTGCAKEKIADPVSTGHPEGRYTDVRVIEEKSEDTESFYRVETTLAGTDLSAIGPTLAEQLAQEWSTYDSMTKEEKLSSSHIWGIVSFESVTWRRLEEAIGITVKNPLENLDWLKKSTYLGMESEYFSSPLEHIRTTVNAANDKRKISEVAVTAGYCTERARVTLTATLTDNAGTYAAAGGIYNGRADYEQNTCTTGSGIPVLIVRTNGSNNEGYYNEDYHESSAYWTKDNVLYNLRVLGKVGKAAGKKEEIQADLDRILADL